MEPRDELRPRRPPVDRRRIVVRRVIAIGAVVLLLGGGAAVALAIHRHNSKPPATTIRQLRQFRILFPEGFTRAQMAARVAAVAKIAEKEIHGRKVKLSEKAYLAATKPQVIPGFGKHTLEGFLFPDTYDFDKSSTAAFLVREQLSEFEAKWKGVDLSYARSKNLTPYDVLKIASMIQGEVAVPSENKLVAAVIYNRLKQGMTLGIDATLRYGLHLPPGKPITQSQLQSDNPYNTRKFTGLPPTPIDNPGIAAIRAAAAPAHVDYLYYLKIPHSKRTYFTASYQDFLNHEAQYGY